MNGRVKAGESLGTTSYQGGADQSGTHNDPFETERGHWRLQRNNDLALAHIDFQGLVFLSMIKHHIDGEWRRLGCGDRMSR